MFCTCLLFYYHNIVKSIASMDDPNLVIEVLITTLHNVLKSYLLIQFCTWVSTNTIFHTSPVIKLLFMKQTTIIYHFSIVNISKCIHVFTICILVNKIPFPSATFRYCKTRIIAFIYCSPKLCIKWLTILNA